MWLGEWSSGQRDGISSALAPSSIASRAALRGALEVEQRHVAGRQQTLVDRAELDHVARVRPRHGIGEVVVLAALQHVGEVEQRRGEHQLAGEAQQIDGARPVLPAPRAERAPVLGQHDLRIRRTSPRPPLGIGQPALEAVAPRKQDGVGDLRAVLRLEMLGEEAGHFHDVRIGVVNDAPAGVGHGSSGSRWRGA